MLDTGVPQKSKSASTVATNRNDNGSDKGRNNDNGSVARRVAAPINSWRVEDRPRTRLLKRGSGSLADAELLAVVFGTGSRTSGGTISAVEIGRSLLGRYGTLRRLATRDAREYLDVPGVGPAKAAQLSAVVEIGRRIEASVQDGRLQVLSPQDVVAAYAPAMRDLTREIFKVVMLNTANYVTGDETISEGGLAVSIVEPRAVFRHAVLENAASIICLHNHPSGNPDPSREDIRITRQLAAAGELMGVPVHDHIIIAGSSYTSLAERGFL